MNRIKLFILLFIFLCAQQQLWAQGVDFVKIQKYLTEIKVSLDQTNFSKAGLQLKKIEKTIKSANNSELTHGYLILNYRLLNRQRKHKEALAIANELLQMSLAQNKEERMAEAYNAIGIQQQGLGSLNVAAEYIIKALKIAESNHNKAQQAAYNSSLSNIFFELREPKKSLYYATKSNQLANQVADSILLKNSINVTLDEILVGKYDLAIQHLKDAEKIYLKKNNTYELVRVYLYLRHAYFRKKQHQLALDYLNKSLFYLKKIKSPDEREIRLHVESAAAESYYALANYNKAQYYFDRNIELAKLFMDDEDVKDVYQLGMNIYEKKGELQTALAYLKKYKKLNDSVSNVSMKNAIHETEIKYQTTIKEKAISEQKMQLINKDFELQQKNRYIFYGIITIIVLVLSAVITYLVYRNKNQSIELSLLKAQIHPHFLFNTLNNLYALSLGKADEAPAVVLGLSSILRYILYECNTLKVDLNKEMEIIAAYVALEKIRYQQRLEVNLNIDGNLEKYQVAPLLILPLVENSFKHGVSKLIDEAWINIEAKIKGNKFIFKISNNKPEEEQSEVNQSKYGNIGLLNIQKRLDILYPKKHRLKITDDDEVFIVMLELTLN